jgi:radical SAM protein with 4Fe4S-binding SPASM domain
MGSCSSPTTTFEQSMSEISVVAKDNRLLTMEIEFSLRCNFNCPYCYVPEHDYFKDELSPREIRDTLLQAKRLGAKKIVILGGEPTIYPNIDEMIRFIQSNEMEVEMFTNGSGISPEFARFLSENHVRVVMKMNTFDQALQDKLAGRKDAFEIIRSALENLKAAGFPSKEKFLAVSTVISRPNIAELPSLWKWLRNQGIEPYFEIITPQANALNNNWLFVDPPDVYNLFKKLSDIDRRDYGIEWEPQPPLVGNRCLRHLFSCLVNSTGEVTPCVGLNLSIGNIRQTPLAQILSKSRVLKDLKDHRNTIKGPCGTCEKADYCYGCRGAAYQMTGDYLASDPLCWRNCQCDACDTAETNVAEAGL